MSGQIPAAGVPAPAEPFLFLFREKAFCVQDAVVPALCFRIHIGNGVFLKRFSPVFPVFNKVCPDCE